MKKLETWCHDNPGKLMLACVLAGVPVAFWLAQLFFRYFDEPWICKRHGMIEATAVFLAIHALWMFTCHCLLCAVNRVSPLPFFTHLFKQVNS